MGMISVRLFVAKPTANLLGALETAIRFNGQRYRERDHERLSVHQGHMGQEVACDLVNR